MASDGLLMVSSRTLAQGAERMRGQGKASAELRNGVVATPDQLDTAARLLREADPCVCNGLSAERPGYIERSHQLGTALTFEIGILPSTRYAIARDGSLIREAGSRVD